MVGKTKRFGGLARRTTHALLSPETRRAVGLRKLQGMPQLALELTLEKAVRLGMTQVEVTVVAGEIASHDCDGELPEPITNTVAHALGQATSHSADRQTFIFAIDNSGQCYYLGLN